MVNIIITSRVREVREPHSVSGCLDEFSPAFAINQLIMVTKEQRRDRYADGQRLTRW
jgi:hypothetical protein